MRLFADARLLGVLLAPALLLSVAASPVQQVDQEGGAPPQAVRSVADDSAPEDVAGEGVPREDAAGEGVPREDAAGEGVPREDAAWEGTPPEDAAREGTPPEDAAREDIPQEGVAGEDTPPQETAPEGVAPAETASATIAPTDPAPIQPPPAPPAPVADATPPTLAPGDSALGRALYAENCARCHGDRAQGYIGNRLIGLRRPLADVTRLVRQPEGMMAAFTPAQLTDQQIAHIYAYLLTLQGD